MMCPTCHAPAWVFTEWPTHGDTWHRFWIDDKEWGWTHETEYGEL